MLERKRQSKNYSIVPGDDIEDHDVELGEQIGSGEQESGVVSVDQPTVTEELDNWDENAEEWDDDEPAGTYGEGQKTPANSTSDSKA